MVSTENYVSVLRATYTDITERISPQQAETLDALSAILICISSNLSKLHAQKLKLQERPEPKTPFEKISLNEDTHVNLKKRKLLLTQQNSVKALELKLYQDMHHVEECKERIKTEISYRTVENAPIFFHTKNSSGWSFSDETVLFYTHLVFLLFSTVYVNVLIHT